MVLKGERRGMQIPTTRGGPVRVVGSTALGILGAGRPRVTGHI
jgi:hypothetical protein